MASLNNANFYLPEILNALVPVKHKWSEIGIQLGIPNHKLKVFKKEDDPLTETIDYWLKGNVEDVTLSWQSLVRALESAQVGELGAAKDIRLKYCQQQSIEIPEKTRNDKEPSKVRKSSTLDPKVRKQLQKILEHNLHDIRRSYASFVADLLESFQGRVNIEALRIYLLNLPIYVPQSGEQCKYLSDDSELSGELGRAKTIPEIFTFISQKCANFLQYDMFADIAKKYGNEDDAAKLKQYSERVEEYVNKHTVDNFLEINPKLMDVKDAEKLTFKIDKEALFSSKLAKIFDLHKTIANILHVEEFALRLCSVEEGCLELTFAVPICVANEIFSRDKILTNKQIADFQALSVEWIRCGNISFKLEDTFSSVTPATTADTFSTATPATTADTVSTISPKDFSNEQLEFHQIEVLSNDIMNSHCTELFLINCNINDKEAVTLADSIGYCSSLRELSMNTNHIRDDGARALADCLRHCTQVKVLDLSFNHIGDTGAMSLAKSLELCTDLHELDFTCNQIGDQGAVALAEYTRKIKDLKLSIWNHKITKEGATDIMKYRSTSNLDIHTFEGTRIGSTKVDILVINMQDSPEYCVNITTLNMDHNNITPDGAISLFDSLKHCYNLQTLNLYWNYIGSDGAKALADSLKYCSNLQTLDLYCNYIGSDGAKALADGLKHCNNLLTLNLDWNDIRSDGAMALADGLKHCYNLQTLNLDLNYSGSDGAKALADSLKHCNNLQMLNIAQNYISSDGIRALADCLKHCNYLQTLNLSWNNINSDGAKALANCLKHCSYLQTLNLSYSNIDSDGAKALADCLKHSIFLQTLNLSWNNIDFDASKAIADGLKHCNNLWILLDGVVWKDSSLGFGPRELANTTNIHHIQSTKNIDTQEACEELRRPFSIM